VDRPVTFYEDLARAARPEVKMLESAVKAKLALADLERRKEYPDLVIVAGAVSRARKTSTTPTTPFTAITTTAPRPGRRPGCVSRSTSGPSSHAAGAWRPRRTRSASSRARR